MGDSAGQRIHAAHAQVRKEWPGVAVVSEVERAGQITQNPHEVPRRQEVGPEVQSLVGRIKQAQYALERGALGVAVTLDNVRLVEVFGHLVLVVELAAQPSGAHYKHGRHSHRPVSPHMLSGLDDSHHAIGSGSCTLKTHKISIAFFFRKYYKLSKQYPCAFFFLNP